MKQVGTRLASYSCLFFFFGIFAQCYAQIDAVKGKVSSQGKPLNNVVVTDGYSTTVTNSTGQYKLDASSHSSFVYVSTPAGYLPKDSLNVPKFYKPLNGNENSTYDFELIKNPKDDSNHVVLVSADPQFFKKEQFKLYEPIIEDFIATVYKYKDQDVFGIDLGDLAADRPDFYSPYINSLNKTNVPFYRVLGNHDMENGRRTKEKSTNQYESYFGPSNYSFNRGNAHYIVLNNVFYMGRPFAYMGYLDEQTYHWMEQDLSYVPKDSPVFISMHIPARLYEKEQPFKYNEKTIRQQTVNIAPLFKMLEPYNVHLLTAHEHYNRNMIHSPTLYEHNTAAISGTFWQEGDYCWDGTPKGYGVYEVNGNDVKWYFKSVGHPHDYQMRAYPEGTSKEHPEDVIVNVWNWDKTWKVEWKENDKNQGQMTQFSGLDPGVTAMFADKDKLDFKWLQSIRTDHMFRATPRFKNSKIEIIATDHFGEVFKTIVSPK